MLGSRPGRRSIQMPCGVFRLRVLARRVHARIHRRPPLPDDLASERQLGERLVTLVDADIQELFTILLADLDAMPATLELTSKRAD
jgi:hypothetical protein